MIISASIRTDVPAFYSEWFFNRIHEGHVLTRNPYNPNAVTRYTLSPDVVDCLFFCTKNPTFMLPRLNEIADYRWFWHITLTPYGKDIEPNVSDKRQIIERFKELSVAVNRHNKSEDAVQWRYDPIIVNEKYTVEQHIKSFEVMAQLLEGYTRTCIVSFVDIYDKVRLNFPSLQSVSMADQIAIVKAFVEIGSKHHIAIKTCVENSALAEYGADCSGCSTAKDFEKAMALPSGYAFVPPSKKFARAECAHCVVSGDIGAYSNCPHLCKYCYANYDKEVVLRNHKLHNPKSPLIIGDIRPSDTIHEAKQKSWIVKTTQTLQTNFLL